MDLASGRVLHRLTGRPIAVAFTADGKTLVANTASGLRLWDVASGKERLARPPEVGFELTTAVSPDGRLLATGDWMDRAVSVWDLSDGRLVRWLPLGGETRYVRDLAFSPDGRTLSAAQFKGFIQFWDVATGQERRVVQLGDLPTPRLNPPFYFRLSGFPGRPAGHHAGAGVHRAGEYPASHVGRRHGPADGRAITTSPADRLGLGRGRDGRDRDPPRRAGGL